MTNNSCSNKIIGVLLAGGLAQRMGGGDKCLTPIDNKRIIDHVIERALPQVDQLILNANGPAERFSEFKHTVVADPELTNNDGGSETFAGPLAGILAAMEWAQQYATDAEWLVSFATDTPFFPRDFVQQCLTSANKNSADIVCAQSFDRTHPVFALWRISLAQDLRQAMQQENMRKIDRWTARYKTIAIDFSVTPEPPLDPFFNANRPDDIKKAQEIVRQHQAYLQQH